MQKHIPVACAILCALLVAMEPTMQAQRSAGESADIDPLFLVDTPIAGILPATSGSVDLTLYPDGGILACFVYGLRTNLNVGLSFGATRFFGSGALTWNNLPGIMVRYRFFEETPVYPAVIAGFDTQGRDGYIPSDRQYAVKSPGVFIAVSKNYFLYGSVCFHGGLNYTIERQDEDMSPNLFVGMEKTVGPFISILGEYNFAFDNDKESKGFWNGNLNFGVRIASKIGLNVDLLLKNLLTTNPYYPNIIRELRVQYVRYM